MRQRILEQKLLEMNAIKSIDRRQASFVIVLGVREASILTQSSAAVPNSVQALICAQGFFTLLSESNIHAHYTTTAAASK